MIVGKNPAKGGKRKFWAEDALGLILMWTHTRGGNFTLQMIFGTTMSILVEGPAQANLTKKGKNIFLGYMRTIHSPDILKSPVKNEIFLPKIDSKNKTCFLACDWFVTMLSPK